MTTNTEAQTKEVSFKRTMKEYGLANRCVRRFKAFPEATRDRDQVMMDLIATNANGCRLDFEKLLGFDDVNFLHDVCGIARHLDRSTGELTGFFLPKCAKPSRSRKAA